MEKHFVSTSCNLLRQTGMPNPHVRIRPYQDEDLDDMYLVIRTSYLHANDGFSSPERIRTYLDAHDPQKNMERCEEFVKHSAYLCVALVSEKIVGVARLKRKKQIPSEFYMSRLFVLPEYQRQGIGSGLIAHIDAIVRDRGGASIALGASLKAVPFYVKLGFFPTKKALQKNGYIIQPMQKVLV